MLRTMINENNPELGIFSLWIIALLIGVFFGGSAANAQMSEQPWGFKAQNRASIAALMQQVENDNNGTTGRSSNNPGSLDTLVCGGDGASSATGNSTCIILNNSNGAVTIGQDANGNQDASNQAEENYTLNGDGLGEVLENIN